MFVHRAQMHVLTLPAGLPTGLSVFLSVSLPACTPVCLPSTPCRGPPLYVGSVPGSPPASYSALLAYKPDKPGTGAAAMVASQMASRWVGYLGGRGCKLAGWLAAMQVGHSGGQSDGQQVGVGVWGFGGGGAGADCCRWLAGRGCVAVCGAATGRHTGRR